MNIVQVINEIWTKISELIYDPQAHSKKDAAWKDVVSSKLKSLAMFKGNKDWLFDRLTVADFILSEVTYYVEAVYPNEYKSLTFLQ